MKDCHLDYSGATFSDPNLADCVASYGDRGCETFGNKITGPATANPMSAVSIMDALFGDVELVGQFRSAFQTRGNCILSSPKINGTVQNVVESLSDSEVYISGASSVINGVNLVRPSSIPVKTYIQSNVPVTPAPWQKYKGKSVYFNQTLVFDKSPETVKYLVVDYNGAIVSAAGSIASNTGYEISGDGAVRHLKVEPDGKLRIYTADGSANGDISTDGTDLFWKGTKINP